MPTLLETALVRHRALTIGALIGLTLLAWAWLLFGASTGMQPHASLVPGLTTEAPMSGMDMAMNGPMSGVMSWSAGRFLLTSSMWWVMMMAMMLPSAAPTILLYARAASNENGGIRPPTEAFLAGYLIAWSTFSLFATILQMLLEKADLIAAMPMASRSRLFSAVILISAGIYQLGPFKNLCLQYCRSPAQFLSRHYRPHWSGALRMGLRHGAYCVGCCWMLMMLLFAGGVMNLAWIALLTLMVAAEKLLPFGRVFARASGFACIAAGTAILLS